MSATATRVDAIWRIESARVIASVARMTRDVGLAEDAAQDAVALGRAFGPDVGLRVVDGLVATGELATYHLLPAVRGDLLARLGRPAEARAEYERAAALATNERERALLRARATSGAATSSS